MCSGGSLYNKETRKIVNHKTTAESGAFLTKSENKVGPPPRWQQRNVLMKQEIQQPPLQYIQNQETASPKSINGPPLSEPYLAQFKTIAFISRRSFICLKASSESYGNTGVVQEQKDREDGQKDREIGQFSPDSNQSVPAMSWAILPFGLSLSLLWETDTQYVMCGYALQCLICFRGSSGVSREPIFRACVAQLPRQSNDLSL